MHSTTTTGDLVLYQPFNAPTIQPHVQMSWIILKTVWNKCQRCRRRERLRGQKTRQRLELTRIRLRVHLDMLIFRPHQHKWNASKHKDACRRKSAEHKQQTALLFSIWLQQKEQPMSLSQSTLSPSAPLLLFSTREEPNRVKSYLRVILRVPAASSSIGAAHSL